MMLFLHAAVTMIQKYNNLIFFIMLSSLDSETLKVQWKGSFCKDVKLIIGRASDSHHERQNEDCSSSDGDIQVITWVRAT